VLIANDDESVIRELSRLFEFRSSFKNVIGANLNAGSGTVLNQSGSTTLICSHNFRLFFMCLKFIIMKGA
jgi:hypothetical protein